MFLSKGFPECARLASCGKAQCQLLKSQQTDTQLARPRWSKYRTAICGKGTKTMSNLQKPKQQRFQNQRFVTLIGCTLDKTYQQQQQQMYTKMQPKWQKQQ